MKKFFFLFFRESVEGFVWRRKHSQSARRLLLSSIHEGEAPFLLPAASLFPALQRLLQSRISDHSQRYLFEWALHFFCSDNSAMYALAAHLSIIIFYRNEHISKQKNCILLLCGFYIIPLFKLTFTFIKNSFHFHLI